MIRIVQYIILLVSLTASQANSAEWEPIGETSRYFDKTSLIVVNKNVVSVSVKTALSAVEVVRLDDNLRKNGSSYDFSKYSHTLLQEYMNCDDDTTALKNVTHYDKSGRPITSSDFSETEYDKVVPNSVGSEILTTICDYAVTNIKK
jgi:hypothetical protein